MKVGIVVGFWYPKSCREAKKPAAELTKFHMSELTRLGSLFGSGSGQVTLNRVSSLGLKR